jgi:polyisoprenoid-binding protein YceI
MYVTTYIFVSNKKHKKMRKLILSAAIAMSIALSANAQNKWTVDASHTNVTFEVTHMVVSDVEGTFKVFSGDVSAKDDTFEDAIINFKVDVASVNTNDEARDKHLAGDDFFNTEKYPNMTFKSTSFKKVSGKNYKLTGLLTIRDVTKPVTFDVTFGGVAKDPWGNIKAGFKGNTKINRTDFKLNWNKAIEAGGWVVSEEVRINLNIELNKAK